MKIFLLLFTTILSFFAYSIPGDNCFSAILVSLNGCSSNTAYNNTGISGTLTNPSCFSTGTNNGMWFEFLAGSQSVNISVVGSSLGKAQVALLSSSTNNCSASSFLEVACNSSNTNTATINYSQLTQGDTYFIYVDGTNNSTGTFKLCVNAINSPQNDEPCNAINLSADNFCSNVNSYTNIGASTENIMLSAVLPCFGVGNEINSVYFKFTAIGSSNTIRIIGSPTGLVRPQIAVLTFDETCSGSAYSLLGCQQALSASNEVSLSINNLIPGVEYIILVDGYSSNTGNFQICLNSFAPAVTVVNDDCINAINLCSDNVYYTSTKNATPNVVNEPRPNPIYDEWNCNGVLDNSIWYKFTTKNILEPISFSITAACNGGRLQFEVFRRMDGQAPCAPNNAIANTTWEKINCVESSTATSSHILNIPISNLIANTDYYVIVDNYPNFFCDFNFSITGNKGADAGPQVTICKPGSPIQLGGEDPLGGTWSGPGVNSTGLLDPNLLSAGNQSVYYNQGGCSATKNVTIATIDVSISNDVEICLGTNTDILGSITVFPSNSTFTYNWTPLGNISNANSLNPTVNPAVNSTYTLSAQDQYGCQDSDNINVLIKSTANITLIVDDQNICGQTATVEAIVNPAGAYNYSWNVPVGFPNPGNVSSFTTGVPGDYTATIIPNNNVCNFDFEDYVISSATAQLNENLIPCWKTTASDNLIEVWRAGAVPAYSGNQFIEINANIASTLHQDNLMFTAGSELEISFAHRGRSGTDVMKVLIGPIGGPYDILGVYSTNNVAWTYYSSSYAVPTNGTYSLRFESVSSAGGVSYGNFLDAVSIKLNDCPVAPQTGTISFIPEPTASISGSTVICNGSSSVINFVGTANSVVTYKVNNGVDLQITLNTSGNASISTGNLSVNTVYSLVSVSKSGCIKTIIGSASISILSKPTVLSFTGGGNYCTGSAVSNVEVSLTGTPNWIISYTLNGAAQTRTGSSSPISLGNSPGSYVLIGISDFNCSNSASGTQNITINQTPLVDSPVNVTRCDSYILPSLTNGNYFTLSGGNGSQLAAGANITSSQTIFVYNETGTNPNCFSESSFNVTINYSPIADFDFKNAELDLIDPKMELINNTTNGLDFTWDFGDEQNSIEENPIHIYEEAKNYIVMLLAVSAEGCKDSIYQNISVIEPLIYYIPNSFSPNGDQSNNTFFPVFTYGYNPFDYHLSIFNRWGELIFESFDPQVGWDGTYKELGLVETGTYVWKIDFGLKINGEKTSIVGTVSLIN